MTFSDNSGTAPRRWGEGEKKRGSFRLPRSLKSLPPFR
jgi:hypothetical protein